MYHAGLTLTMATRLLLVDVPASLIQERQLINRVHRIGQEKPVEVVRLVLRNTIEERLYQRRAAITLVRDEFLVL